MITAAWLERARVRANFAALRGLGAVLPLRGPRRDGCLIVPSAGSGSVGDEAMLVGLVSACRMSGLKRVDLFAPPEDLQALEVDERRWPAGGKLSRRWMKWRILGDYQYVFVIGADCIDGAYSLWRSNYLLTIAHLASAAGAVVTIVGSSFNTEPHPAVVAAIRALPPSVRLCLRERPSLERVRGSAAQKGILVADVAFLLQAVEPDHGSDSTLNWIREQRATGQTLLGINLNTRALGQGNVAQAGVLLKAYAKALERLLAERPDLSLLIVPHDYRGELNDLLFGERLLALLAHRSSGRVALFPGLRTAAEVKGVAGYLDAVLTGRMHLAIAALGRGVPVACIAYQDKFEGLFEHFGLPQMLLSPEQACEERALYELAQSLLQERERLKKQIASRLPAVRARSWMNLPEELREPIGGAVRRLPIKTMT